MSIVKLLPKFLTWGALGLTTAGGLYLNNGLPLKGQEKSSQSSIIVETKNSESMFLKQIDPKLVLEFLKTNKYLLGITSTSACVSLFLFKYIGFGNIMYATRNQLSRGIVTLSTKISKFKDTFDGFKKTILGKVDTLDSKITQNHENIKLTIKQKSDELKCEIKDVKSNQNKSQGMLDLMSDKINIIESQGKFISNETFQPDDIDQIKQYKLFKNHTEKVT